MNTSFFAWNMRGFNLPRKQNVLKDWIHAVNPLFGCLLETRVQEDQHAFIMASSLQGWQALTNYDHHRLGRIWVLWTDAVVVNPIHKSAQSITCTIEIKSSGHQFICSFVYASNFVEERIHLWEEIREIQRTNIHLSLPWILLGDFNEILSSIEHSRSMDYMVDQTGMRHFQDVVQDCDLSDLAYVGPCFTWWNHQDVNPVGKKLDRALINNEWLAMFPQSFATFKPGGVSDHARCWVQISDVQTGVRKPFKFFNYLSTIESFIDTVAGSWFSTPPLFHSRAALHLLQRKLKLLKPILRALNNTHYGDLPRRTKEAFELLCLRQEEALTDPQQSTFEAEAVASSQWSHLSSIEEQFFKQKSRIRWLNLGDQNTTFFHRVAQGNASNNAIRSLTTLSGDVVTEIGDIKREASSYFQSFLQAQPTELSVMQDSDLAQIIDFRCPSNVATSLVSPILAAEIREVIFHMPSNKAPGPDGYTMEFYKAAWPVIGPDIVTAVQSFFVFGFLPKGVNATILSIIPKHEEAITIRDYRPIACCNLLYKVISKIIANRLKHLLPEAIEPNQSAFVKGRLLLENVLLATELVKDYHRDSVSSRCAIKFDISKAFDTIQWSFVVQVLRVMNFPERFVEWIHTCISTASFSVSVNGDLAGFFTSSRGIRQGCSLSPYIYVIINNVLSKMLNAAAARGDFGYHPRCSAVGLTHLSFADDILVFSDGKAESIRGILNSFQQFAAVSGLCINISKSSVFVAGEEKENLAQAVMSNGLSVDTLPIRYLGLPLTTKTMTRSDYEPLVDKIRGRLLSWSSKSLSFAGRLQLIKSVISSISNFWCSVFRLPKRCFEIIESMCGAFLWSGSPNDHNKAKVSWEEICYPKEEGGLGIRRLQDTSKVFALSLIWRLFTKTDSLWVVWTKHYLLRHSSFWDIRNGNSGSWIWRKLLKLREEAAVFLQCEVSHGVQQSQRR